MNSQYSNPFFNRVEFYIAPLTPTPMNKMALIERKHRHIVEMGLILLAQAHFSLNLWDHAFLTTIHLVNCLTTPLLNH